MEQGLNWNLSNKASFALGKLYSVRPKDYAEFRIFESFNSAPSTDDYQEQFQEMWCHDQEDCQGGCWDENRNVFEGHSKGCHLYPL